MADDEDPIQKAASASISKWEQEHANDQLGIKLDAAAPQILSELTRLRFEMTAIRQILERREDLLERREDRRGGLFSAS